MKDFLTIAFVAYVLWTVAYLFWERFSQRSSGKQQTPVKPIPENQNDDDIIGKGTFVMSHLMPQAATAENQKNGMQKEDSFATSSKTKPSAKVPDDQLEETFSHNGDDNRPMDIDVPLEYQSADEHNPEDDEEDPWLTGNTSLAEGATFEEIGAAVKTIVHYGAATLPDKEQAGGILLKIRQTDMFEQLVQSAPRREDQVSQAMNLHLSGFYRRMAEKKESDEKYEANKNDSHSQGKSEVPADFDVNDFV